MEGWCSSSNAHHNAAMEFYTDGSLLVASGDSSQASFDKGYPSDEDGEPVDLCYLDGEKQPQGYFKAQNDAFLQGHLIRIHPEAVMYEHDSEYLPLTDADYDIWGKGLRNLFRMAEDKTTGDIYIADVGQITVEEISILRNPLKADPSSLPANFGWPCVEGDIIPLPTYNWLTQSCDVNDDNDNCDICSSLFACTSEASGNEGACDPTYVAPSFQYDHAGSLTTYDGQEDLCGGVGNSVSAIAFFEGRLYAADYSKTCLWYFEEDSSGSPDMSKPRIIAEGVGANFVDLVDGGDGYLYATNFALSKLVRVDPGDLDALERGSSTSSTSPTTSPSSAGEDDGDDGHDSDDGNDGSTQRSPTPAEITPSPMTIDTLSPIDATPSPVDTTPSPVDAAPSPVDETPVPVAEMLMKPPVARLRGLVSGLCFSPCEIETGTEIRFTGVWSGTFGDDNNITKYALSFGDGSEGYVGPSAGEHPHTYKNDGVFLATLVVTDSYGLTGTETMTVVVGEPFALEMSPESGEWVVGDTIQFNLTRRTIMSAIPDSITWSSMIEHCTSDPCTGEVGCHLHSLQGVETAEDSMSGSVVSIAHPLPSQVIVSAQMMYGTTVIEYEWPTSALTRTVTAASVPPGLTIYYGDETCEYSPCEVAFMSDYPASFEASSIQSTMMKIYGFDRWEVTNRDNSTDTYSETALDHLKVDVEDLTVTVSYKAITPTVTSDISPPVVTAVGGFYTKLAVEWARISQEEVDSVIAYAESPDHDVGTYQSSKAVSSALSTSTELMVPAGESNFTVYLRAYNSVNNTISGKSSEYVVASAPLLNSSDSLCPEDVPDVVVTDDDGEEGQNEPPSSSLVVEFSSNASAVPGIVQAEDFDAGGEGVAYHDNNTYDEGGSNYREGEGVDLERSIGGVVNVAWTEPGEWISYTVQHPGNETVVQDVSLRYTALGGSNGIVLALDLGDPSECPELEEGDKQVILINGNLAQTQTYFDWAWTGNASVALTPGPHVVTLCFIGNAVVNVDLLRFGNSDCGNGVCQWTDGEETCSSCPQDCAECPTAYATLLVPGKIQAEDFDLGGEVGNKWVCIVLPEKCASYH